MRLSSAGRADAIEDADIELGSLRTKRTIRSQMDRGRVAEMKHWKERECNYNESGKGTLTHREPWR